MKSGKVLEYKGRRTEEHRKGLYSKLEHIFQKSCKGDRKLSESRGEINSRGREREEPVLKTIKGAFNIYEKGAELITLWDRERNEGINYSWD